MKKKRQKRKQPVTQQHDEMEQAPANLHSVVRTNRFTRLVIEGLAEMGFEHLNGALWQYVALVYASVQTDVIITTGRFFVSGFELVSASDGLIVVRRKAPASPDAWYVLPVRGVVIVLHFALTGLLFCSPFLMYGLITGQWKWGAIQALAMIGAMLGTLVYMGNPFLPGPYSFAGGEAE